MQTLNETIERIKVDSSQIETVAHDVDAQRMEISFKTGSVYVYDNVTSEIVAEMLASESVGKYFGVNIKLHVDKFPFVKIRGPFSPEEKAMRLDQQKIETEGSK